MNAWYVSIVLASIFTAPAPTILSPAQIAKFGPMTEDECVKIAQAITDSTIVWHAQCDTQLASGAQEIRSFVPTTGADGGGRGAAVYGVLHH